MSHTTTHRFRVVVRLALVLLSLVIIGNSPASAATLTYVGPNFGAWSVASHWSPAQVPGSGDDVILDGAVQVTFQDIVDLEIRSITFSGVVDQAVDGTASLRLIGGITKNGSGIANITRPVTVGQAQVWTVNSGNLVVDIATLDNAVLQIMGGGTSCNVVHFTGSGEIVKNGSHVLNVTGDGTFTGPVTVDAGTLSIGHADSLGAGGTMANGTTINSGGTLNIMPAVATLNEPLRLNGAGAPGLNAALFVDDAGEFPLASPVILDGPTTIYAALSGAPGGAVRFTGPVSGPGGLVVRDQTTVVLEYPDTAFASLNFSGTGSTVRVAQGLGAFTTGPAVTIPAGNTLDLASFSMKVSSLTGDGTVALGAGGGIFTLDVSGTSTFTGTINGVGTVQKTGLGEQVLASANSYIGQTIVARGTLRVAHANALGVSDGTLMNHTIVLQESTLLLDGVSLGNEALVLDGFGHLAGGALRVAGVVPVSIAGGVTLNGETLLASAGAADLTLAGPLTTFGEQLRIAAPLSVTLTSPTNSFVSGNIRLDGGVLRIGHSGALDPTTKVNVNGGTLALDGRLLRLAELVGLSGTVAFGTGGTLELTTAFDGTFAGTMTGTGSIVKSGANEFRLTGVSTFSGPVTVNGGVLGVAHAQALPNSSFTVQPGGVLRLEVPLTITSAVSLSGNGPGGLGGALAVWGGPVTFAGPTTIAASTLLQVGITSQLTLQGAVTGPALRFGGGGTIVLPNVTHGIGGLEYVPLSGLSGTLRLGAPQTLPSSFAVALPAGATLDLAGFPQTLAGISGAGTVAIGAGTLMLANVTADVQFEGTLTGTGSLVVNAAPFGLAMSGTHTLTGNVTIAGGTFTYRGVLPAAIQTNGTAVTFAAGPSTVGPLTVQDGSVSLGMTTNTHVVTAAGFTLTGASAFRPVIHGPAATPSTPLIVNGAVSLSGGALEPVLAGFTPEIDVPITLIANDGTDPVTGTFTGLAEGAFVTVGGQSLRLSYAGGDGNDVTLMRIDPNPPPPTYLLAEGATGTFFDTDLLIANPQTEPVTVEVTFLPQDGEPLVRSFDLAARSRLTIPVDTLPGLESAAFSTRVVPSKGPLIVERTMSWDATGYGGHTDKATEGAATTWYFAEGAEGFFRTFLLLANPSAEANTATVTFLRENDTPVIHTIELDPQSRFTFAAADSQELVDRSFGIRVEFSRPGMAERAMYFGGDPLWMAGHESAGVTALSNTWFLAEGATGEGFETFILVANPNTEDVEATLTFLPEIGEPATIKRTVSALSRITVNIDAEDLPIPDGPVATQVSAPLPVIAERAQYWPFTPDRWLEAHNSFGVTATAPRWGLAEGRVGGPRGYQTFILLANPGTETAMVTLSFLGEGTAARPADRIIEVPAQRRITIGIDPPDPAQAATTTTHFGTHIDSTQPIAVERALYWNAGGVVWSAGTNATATRLP